VLLDYRAPTPLTASNVGGHIVAGADGCQVSDTMVAGRWLMRRRELVGLDEEEIAARSRERAGALWHRAVMD
jgi:cytosine/adenosine deaminase-related metal-dependent hydrolase